jgi:hypothetical protein
MQFESQRLAWQNHNRPYEGVVIVAESIVASFEREEALVEHLLRRSNLRCNALSDPNASGLETGMDVVAHLADGRTIGIQVTEIDPHVVPGKARAEEKRIAGQSQGSVYAMWTQNDPRLS